MKTPIPSLIAAGLFLLGPTIAWAEPPAPPAPPIVPAAGELAAPAPPAPPGARGRAPAAPPAPPTIPAVGRVAPAPPSPPVVLAAATHPAPPIAPVPPVAAVHPEGHPRVLWATGGDEPRLGTQVSSMSPELRDFFGAPSDAGILVQRVEPGSAAEAAKVKVGDVLVSLGGHPITRASDVREALAARDADEVEVVVIRKGKRKTLRASLPRTGGSPRASGPGGPGMPAMPSMPPMPTFPEIPPIELPPEVQQHLDPQQREAIERELSEARERLREAERQLQQQWPTNDPPHARPPEPPRPQAAPKGETRTKPRKPGRRDRKASRSAD